MVLVVKNLPPNAGDVKDTQVQSLGREDPLARGRGRLRGFLELRRPWGFSTEARRGSQGASRAAPGKSGLHARGEGERVLALESPEQPRGQGSALSRLGAVTSLAPHERLPEILVVPR